MVCRYEIGGEDDPDVIAQVRWCLGCCGRRTCNVSWLMLRFVSGVCCARDVRCRSRPQPPRLLGVALLWRTTEAQVKYLLMCAMAAVVALRQPHGGNGRSDAKAR
jgi:hypothetical protein